MRNKKNCLNVKILHKLRKLSKEKIGVFWIYGEYCVILDIDNYFGDPIYHESGNCDVCKSLKEAKEKCDYYRRKFILEELEELKEEKRKQYY